MGLYEKIKVVATHKGYSINRLEKELGFARSSISKFNKNVPGMDKVKEVADFLGVPITDLTEDSHQSQLTAKDERDIAKDLDRIMNEIKSGENGPLYYNGVEINDASINLLKNAIEFALTETKIENKVKYNPRKNKK